QEVSPWKKLYVIYNFFFIRKVVAHVLTFTFYCVVVPISVLVPEVEVPIWGIFYIPTTISLLNAMRNPRFGFVLVILQVVTSTPFPQPFNVMAMHRMRATIIGLLEIGGVNEWVVTEKLGNTLKEKTEVESPKGLLERIKDRVYLSELGCGVFLLFCASYNLAYGSNHYYVYIYLQAIAFFLMGFGFVGTHVSQS
ncbi:hypothetical protein Taro_038708, partial [Colocasia esculenta]|nr:hypothetical protein [Colocasia esculenta]